MNILPILNTIDPSLGRLDYTMLSDQACFEIFFQDCTPIQKLRFGVIRRKDDPNAYVDVCEWKGAECDAEGNVLKILIRCTFMGLDEHVWNKFNFAFMPRKLTYFQFYQLKCSTEFSTADLPEGLEEFYFRGRIEQRWKFEAKDIPRRIVTFDSERSRFEGTCDLTVLPSRILWLKLPNNLLTGTLDLNHLPDMKVLELSNNAFHGSIHITHLPSTMGIVNLSGNNFSGSCVILSIPSSLIGLSVSGNNLSGTAVLLKAGNGRKCKFGFFRNRINAVNDEQGEKHPLSKWILEKQRKDTE